MSTSIAKVCFDENWACNTYFIGKEGEPCLIIDPGSNRDNALNRYVKLHHKGRCLGILLTHGHFDHISGLSTFSYLSSDNVWLAEEDVRCLTSPVFNGSVFFHLPVPVIISNIATHSFNDQEKIQIGSYAIVAIKTPFHTLGSSCFYLKAERALFTGDTVFYHSIGRTDMPGGDETKIPTSLSKLLSIPEDTILYPGHGENTTMKEELSYNDAFLGLIL